MTDRRDRSGRILRAGGCHCRRVRFEVATDPEPPVFECNCSICRMQGYLHLIVPQGRLHWLAGRGALAEYRFGSETAVHTFCAFCGIKPVYVPRSNPDGYSVNLRCLDDFPDLDYRLRPFDGRNWEDHADELAGLSRE